ncbi:MAG TPA: hypothetical protein PLX08_01725 [Bacteroidales bacterium]|nr:hypothetical protein [Bacteroidales bacterium]
MDRSKGICPNALYMERKPGHGHEDVTFHIPQHRIDLGTGKIVQNRQEEFRISEF